MRTRRTVHWRLNRIEDFSLNGPVYRTNQVTQPRRFGRGSLNGKLLDLWRLSLQQNRVLQLDIFPDPFSHGVDIAGCLQSRFNLGLSLADREMNETSITEWWWRVPQ